MSKSYKNTGSFFESKETAITPSRTYQIHKKYIVSSIKSGMLVVDQNKAHQRILYEQYLTNITVNKASSQQLLFPLELRLLWVLFLELLQQDEQQAKIQLHL